MNSKNAKRNRSTEINEDDTPKPKVKEKKSRLSKGTIWAIKITIITFILAFCVTFVTEITSTKSNIVIAILLLLFLIVIAILFDAIGVAAASCDLPPLLSMASRRIKGAQQAVKLVKNAEKVSNICNDVIGDMVGIISGICAATIVLKIVSSGEQLTKFSLLISILMSSVVSAVTVGGKAFFKSIAMKNSKEMMMLAGRIIAFFTPKKKK